MKLNQLVQGKLATLFYKGSANTISILKLFKFQDESGLSFSPSVSSTTCSRTDTMGIVVQVFHQTMTFQSCNQQCQSRDETQALNPN